MIFIVFLIAIIILLIIIIRDYRHLHRINPTTDILFATDPEKKQLDLMISDGFPIVIIDKIQDSVSLKDLSEKLPNLQITYNYKTKDTTNTIEMKDLHSHLDDFLLLKNESIVENLKLDNIIQLILYGFNRNYVYYPVTNIYSHIVSKDTRIPLRKNTFDTNIIVAMNGSFRIFMVSPLYQQNMYEKDSATPIDIWNPDMKKYPKYKSVKISSDIINEKEMVYIPPKWWYAIYAPDTTFMIQIERDNILSQYIK